MAMYKELSDSSHPLSFRLAHRPVVVAAAAIALFVILSLAVAATPDSIIYPIHSAHFSSDGFWSLEDNGERSYRWTKGRTHIRFPGLEGTSLLHVVLHLSAPQQPDQTAVAAMIVADTGSPLRFDITPEWRTYHILFNTQASDTPAFTLITDTWRPATDWRLLGVLSGQMQVSRLYPAHTMIKIERWLFLTSIIALCILISRRIHLVGLIIIFPTVFLFFLAFQKPDIFVRLFPTKWYITAQLAAFTFIVEILYRHWSNSPRKNHLINLFLIVYILAGLYTHSKFVSGWLSFGDFKIYERALTEALAGKGPYNNFEIGSAYLYPPSALFLIEIFQCIDLFVLRASIFSAISIILMIMMIYGVSTMYGYKINQIWYWYILCLFFAPFLETIHMGQINVVTLFGVSLFFIFQSLPLLGSFGLSMAILTKFSPILFIIYSVAQKKWKTLFITLLIIVSLAIAAQIRYNSSIEYISIIKWLTNQFVINSNSQSLASKLFMTNHWIQPSDITFMRFLSDYKTNQRFLNFYIIGLILLSNLLLFIRNSPVEPAFIITGIGMTLLPNVMWYHHYVFLLLPILIWVCWQKLNGDVVRWCLIGLLITQIDRFHLTTGLLVHVFGHVSMLWVLYQQIKINKVSITSPSTSLAALMGRTFARRMRR